MAMFCAMSDIPVITTTMSSLSIFLGLTCDVHGAGDSTAESSTNGCNPRLDAGRHSISIDATHTHSYTGAVPCRPTSRSGSDSE